jgi:hypothetical protein
VLQKIEEQTEEEGPKTANEVLIISKKEGEKFI